MVGGELAHGVERELAAIWSAVLRVDDVGALADCGRPTLVDYPAVQGVPDVGGDALHLLLPAVQR